MLIKDMASLTHLCARGNAAAGGLIFLLRSCKVLAVVGGVGGRGIDDVQGNAALHLMLLF